MKGVVNLAKTHSQNYLEQPKIEIDRLLGMKEVVISKSSEVTPSHNRVQVKANK